MPNIKTQGIVIAKRDFSERDRIFWIFTQDKGLIQAFGKGVRKILARLSGHLEIGNVLELGLYKGKTFYTITDAGVIYSYSYLKNDLGKTSILYHFCELIKIFMPLDTRHSEVFTLLISSLNLLGRKSTVLAKIYFELKFIGELGFGPELYKCACGKKVEPNDNYFSFQGGVLCSDSALRDKSAIKISDSVIKLFRWIAIEDAGNLPLDAKVDAKVLQEAEKILDLYLEYLAEKKLHSLDFMKKVKRF